MLYKTLPLYCFPTTVAFLDDDPNFLKALRFGIDNANFYCKFFNDQALFHHYVKYGAAKANEHFLRRNIEEEYDQISLVMDLNDVHKKSYYSSRHEEQSVVIVDYCLWDKTGIEVLRELDGSFKKILLTGIADESTAIKAVNRGDIDFYLKKNEHGWIEALIEQILYAQSIYFAQQGKEFLNKLTTIGYSDTLLSNAAYVELFNRLFSEYSILEAYLLDPTGSYVFIDSKGDNYCLLAYTEAQLLANQECVYLEKLSRVKKQKIQNKEMAFYPKPDLFKKDPLFSIDRAECKEQGAFYYSFVKGVFRSVS